MHAEVTWTGARTFNGHSGSGHRISMAGRPEPGDEDGGVRPMEMILLGLGGCSSIDVVDILEKGRETITSCSVEIEADRVDAVPAVFERIHLHYRVGGEDLDAGKVARAIELSMAKYCSVSIMLQRGGVAITHDFELVSDES